MTLHEADLLALRYLHQQAREDRRAALVPWLLGHIHRDPEAGQEPSSLEEIMRWLSGKAAQAAPPPPPADPVDAMRKQMTLLNGLYGGRQV